MHATYFRAPALYQAMPHERAWMYWAFNRERRGFIAALAGRELFVFHTQIKPGEEPRAARPEAGQAHLAPGLEAQSPRQSLAYPPANGGYCPGCQAPVPCPALIGCRAPPRL